MKKIQEGRTKRYAFVQDSFWENTRSHEVKIIMERKKYWNKTEIKTNEATVPIRGRVFVFHVVNEKKTV